ncbi:MAG: hypothetical protein NVV73_02785 [Cellvibrionaceae bacterium]|nr:hypothetical protein [Cellvibrionaceae bacterium]
MSSDFSQNKDLFVFKDDEQLIFVTDTGSPGSGAGRDDERHVWRILIADDEQDVHDATCFALRDTVVLGRTLEFYHAYNSAQALEILRAVPDIAVILLDVVMETSNAGLDLVPVIREQLKLQDLRIILRTGEPNQAPEIDVIREYDINDYKLKSDLTKKKLYVSLTSAVRSYKQLRTIENSKKRPGHDFAGQFRAADPGGSE